MNAPFKGHGRSPNAAFWCPARFRHSPFGSTSFHVKFSHSAASQTLRYDYEKRLSPGAAVPTTHSALGL
jgi:hypothetical protein